MTASHTQGCSLPPHLETVADDAALVGEPPRRRLRDTPRGVARRVRCACPCPCACTCTARSQHSVEDAEGAEGAEGAGGAEGAQCGACSVETRSRPLRRDTAAEDSRAAVEENLGGAGFTVSDGGGFTVSESKLTFSSQDQGRGQRERSRGRVRFRFRCKARARVTAGVKGAPGGHGKGSEETRRGLPF